MKQQNYLPLPLSRLVNAKVPDMETGAWYNTYFSTCKEGHETHFTYLRDYRGENSTPAFRLDDLMRALKALDTTGWQDAYYRDKMDELLDAYCADGLLRLDGKNVEEFITKYFV